MNGPGQQDDHRSRASGDDEQGRWRPGSGGDDVDDASSAHDLTAAYAVDALEADEAHVAETHLTDCGPCRADLAAIREALAASVVPLAPPAALRVRVMDALDDVSQLPPLTDQTPGQVSAAETAAAETVAPETVATGGGRDELAARRARGPRRSRSHRWVQGLAAAAAAVVVAVAALSGYAALQWRGEAASARQAAVALAQVAAAPDVVTVSAEGDDAWSGTRVLASRSRGEAVLVPAGAHSAPEGSTWQLWFVTEEVARPAGTFAGADGSPEVLSGEMGEATAVAVTLEPAGGSDAPTTTPVAVYSLSA